MALLDLQGMELKADVSSAGARNSGSSKGCGNIINVGGGGHGGGGDAPSGLSLLLC